MHYFFEVLVKDKEREMAQERLAETPLWSGCLAEIAYMFRPFIVLYHRLRLKQTTQVDPEELPPQLLNESNVKAGERDGE
ncbi:MAG: hypothetical protein ACOCX5_04930 [Chloroflexota bacterium]